VETSGLSGLLRTSRPRFWIYLLGPWLLGSFAGAHDHRWFLSWPFWFGLVACTLPANLFVYGVNDIHDTETDRLNAKKAEGGDGYERYLPPEQHRTLARQILIWNLPAVVAMLAAAIVGPNVPALIAIASFVFFSWGYSAPPIRAKARPFVDSIFNILYACPGFAAYFLSGGPVGTGVGWIVGAAWLWCMAMHAFSAVPDIEADREAKLATVATALGGRWTLAACGIFYVVAAGITGWVVRGWQFGTATLVAMGMAYALLVAAASSGRGEEQVFRVYKIFPYVNASIGFGLTLLVLWNRWAALRP
jgi:4-hydroxybenzoate polyprenyltransferase